MSDSTDVTPAGLLVVCTANVCRSPYVQHSLAQRLRAVGLGGFPVHSAGTRALVGQPIAEPMGVILAAQGVDLPDRVARQLTAGDISGVELVLTAERAHRSDVAQLVPTSHRKTFTVRQFARLLERVDEQGMLPVGEGISALVAACAAARGAVPSQGLEDDIPDPWRRPTAEYERVVTLIEPALDRIARAVAAAMPSSD